MNEKRPEIFDCQGSICWEEARQTQARLKYERENPGPGKIFIKNPDDVDNLWVDVTQGYSGPDKYFDGTYGEFWTTISYKDMVATRHGSYETGCPDKITDNMRIRLNKELGELKELCRDECRRKGYATIDLEGLATAFLGHYNEIKD